MNMSKPRLDSYESDMLSFLGVCVTDIVRHGHHRGTFSEKLALRNSLLISVTAMRCPKIERAVTREHTDRREDRTAGQTAGAEPIH